MAQLERTIPFKVNKACFAGKDTYLKTEMKKKRTKPAYEKTIGKGQKQQGVRYIRVAGAIEEKSKGQR